MEPHDTPHHESHRLWLVARLEEMKRRNPLYSLRAFAAHVGMSPATLSQVISGKRPLTRRMAERIADRCRLAPDERAKLFQTLATDSRPGASGSPDAAARDAAKRAFQTLEVDVFRSIADWHHYALLSLAKLPGNRAEGRWLSKALKIPQRVAEEALTRLIRLGLLAIEDGRLRRTGEPLTVAGGLPSQAIRSYHVQNLRKAEEALEQVPVERRDFSSMTMAIDPARLPEARERIKAFRRELAALLEAAPGREVYTLALQLFPVTHLTADEGGTLP